MPYIQPSVIHPCTGLSDPFPTVTPTNEASDNGQQGWLTDQLRGKRVWCRISINCLLICEQKELAVVRQAILLPGCRVRQLGLKPADQTGKTLNGITRHFMSATASRLDKFYFILENLVSGQQFLFGVDTLCEFNQWWMVLDKACSLPADLGGVDDQQICDSNQWNNQLKRVCSEPHISTGVVLGQSSNPYVPFTAVGFVKNDAHPVQLEHEKTYLVQLEHETADLIQPGKEKAYLVQPGEEKSDLVQPGKEKADLVQPGEEKSDLVQPGKEKADLVQPGKEKADLVQPGKEKADLVQPGEEKADLVQPGEDKTDLIQSDHDKTDLLPRDVETTDTPAGVQRLVHDKPDNSHITSLPLKVKHDINHTAYAATTWSNNQSTTRQARSVIRFKPSLGAVIRRLSRSASTDNRRKLHSLADPQTDENITDPSLTSETDSSDVLLEHKKQLFGTKRSPEVTNPKVNTNSRHQSFSFPRLASRIFGENTFYKDAFSKPAITTLKDLKEVRLSGYLLCRTGSKLRRVYCALSHGCLYMFSSTRPDSVPERTVLLNQYSVTYVSDMRERSGNLFNFKLSQPGRDSICLSTDSQQSLLKWMAATQCASVGLQSAEDLVSELSESKQDLQMGSSRDACLQGGPNVESDTWQSWTPMDALNTDLTRHRMQENENVPKRCENYGLSMLEGLPTNNTYTTTNSVLQSASLTASRQAETSSMLEANPNILSSDHVQVNSDQSESSKLCDLPTNMPHGDNAETYFKPTMLEKSTYVQSRAQSVQTLDSPTPPVTPFQTASTRTSKGFKQVNTQPIQSIVPGVCSFSQQDVKLTDDQRQTPPQHRHRPDVSSTQLNEVERDVLQPNLLGSLVHDEAVKQAWATTEPCLLDVVKEKIQQRHTRGTIPTDQITGRHDVCIVEDDWNLADTNMNATTLLSFDNKEQRQDWLASMRTTLAEVDLPSSTHTMGARISSSPTSLGTAQFSSAGTARQSTSADNCGQHTEETARQTNTDTFKEVQQQGSVNQAQSLESAKEKLLAEIVRQKCPPKTMQAKSQVELSGNSPEVSFSPARRSLPPDVDKVCVMTKLLQRRMSTQIQLNAVHSQMGASRDGSKEKNVLFQIGKKKTETAQENSEITSRRSELGEQARVLSLQLQELDTFLSAYGAPSPIPQIQGRNNRLRHSYDQVLMKNSQLTAETRTDTSNTLNRNHEKLKDKVSQLYRSLSLKSSVQKFAQKTFSRANWHRNKKSTHQIEEKARAKTSTLITINLPGGTNADTDTRSKELSDCFDGSVTLKRPNRMVHKETTAVGRDLPEPCRNESSLQDDILLKMSPSVGKFGVCAGNVRMSSSLTHIARDAMDIQMSRSLTDLDRCTEKVQMSPTLTHLSSCRHDIKILPSHLDRHKENVRISPLLTQLDRRTQNIQISPLLTQLDRRTQNIKISPLLTQLDRRTQNIQMSPLLTQLDRRTQNVQMSPSSSSLNKLSFKQKSATRNSFCDSFVTSQLNGDLQDTCDTAQLNQGDLLETSATTQWMGGGLLDTVVLSAIVNAGGSTSTDSCKEIITPSQPEEEEKIVSEPTSVRDGENVVSEPTSVRDEENVVSEPTSVRGQGNNVPRQDKRQVSSSALAEIQAFETLLEKCLGPEPSLK